MKMKRCVMAVSIGLAGTLLAACGSSSSNTGATGKTPTNASSKQKTIGVAVADQKSLFYIAAVDGMKKAATELGAKLIVLSADNDANKQVNQVNDLLTQKIDVLVFIAQDATAAADGVRAANKANVPVIAVDEKPESGSGQLATYIATDSVKAADALCTWMFAQMGGSGEIGILRGVLGATAELQRSKGCKQALDRTPGIKVVATQSTNWDETQGYKAAQNMLASNPGIKAIFGESDAMGLGAAKPFLFRQETDEIGVRVGEHGAHAVQEPVDLALAAQKHAAQHAAGHAGRVRLRIGQCQRGAPGPAEQQPFVDAKMAAQGFDVADQMRGGVVRQPAEGPRPTRAALVENDYSPDRRVEKPSMHRPGARARAPMQEQCRAAAWVARLLPVHHMAVGQRQVAGLVGSNLGKQITAWHGPMV